MSSDIVQNLVSEYSIDIDKLLEECGIRESIESIPYINKNKTYNPFTTTNINAMSTYNAFRYLYRTVYDLRSCGKKDLNSEKIIGREIHPTKNIEMPINYINDFSISPIFQTKSDCDFIKSICDIYPNATYALKHKDIHANMAYDRQKQFITKEQIKTSKGYTSDFFSYNTQVNPLLYTFACIDPNDRKLKYMDSDLFLELNLYEMIFDKDSYPLKGNQYAIPIWLSLTDTESRIKELYDDDGNVVGYESVFDNINLFSDNYTEEFLDILQNGGKYYHLNAQSDYIKDNQNPVSEEDTRGHLFYDTLLKLVIDRTKACVINSSSSQNDKEKVMMLEHMILKSTALRNSAELTGFPIDQYIALDTYKLCENDEDNIQEKMEEFKDAIGEYNINVYQQNYNLVFGLFFRILPYILSPSYKFHIQSPAMSIMYSAFSLMAIKNAFYHNQEDYDIIYNNLYKVIDNIEDIDKDILANIFDEIFTKDILNRNVASHLVNVLPILIKNSAAINYDEDLNKDAEKYFNYEKFYSYIETGEDIDSNILLDKAVILLTEFFNKMDSIRYFDASTFCIDYTDLKDKNIRRSLKLFADSLMEACYIHLNILGSEIFFNGKAPQHQFITENSLLKDNNYEDLLGLDITRVAKNNINLINQWGLDDKQYVINSYHSYIPIINLYTSLVYCLQITVDNLSINNYLTGPYRNSNIKRSQALWTILKRYAIHLTYINNNSYGIWNDVQISSNNRSEIQRMMASHRAKWLTYGLHLRVWFNDGYMFYTNYKKLMMDFHGDVNSACKELLELYSTHTEGITEPLMLFRNTLKSIIIPMPNVGLSLYPMAGSYSITANAICLRYYLDNNEILVNLIHHGLKDIMIGDSLSSIIGDRLECIRPFLNNEKLSINNIKGIFQNIYDELGTSKYHELALSSNLNFLFNLIKEHFKDKNNLMILNKDSSILIENSIFENESLRCTYPLAYNNSILYRILLSILNSNDISIYSKFINKIITLFRIACANFKTWHSHSESDRVISDYYNKYYGLSTFISLFVKDYSTGIRTAFANKDKFGIFSKIVKNIFTGNIANQYSISNLMSVTFDKFSFEDAVINNTAGGTIYGLYESSSMLMIYNNTLFGTGYVDPTLEQLFVFGRDLFGRIYSTMKRLFVDLTFNGDPINKIANRDKCSIEYAQDTFITDSIEYFYTITNNVDCTGVMFKDIKEKDSIYSFACIFNQFMDYDYIANQTLNLLTNHQYSLTKNEDIVKYLNNLIANRVDDIRKFSSYCERIDKLDNQLNSIINLMIERKQGSLDIKTTTKDSKAIDVDVILEKASEESIDYNKKIAELEIQLSQLKRLQANKNKTDDSLSEYEKELFTLASKGKDIQSIIFGKLSEMNSEIDSLKEIILDTNRILKRLLQLKETDYSNSSEKPIDKDTADKDLTLNSQIFVNKLKDEEQSLLISDYEEYPKPIQPHIIDENSIEFYNNCGETCTVVKDLRDSNTLTIGNSEYSSYNRLNILNQEEYKITVSNLNDPYSVINLKRFDYRKFFYIPSYYLREYIPEYNDSKISIKKAILQNIPIYSMNKENLLLVIENIPISFNQKIEYIIDDIKDRISLIYSNTNILIDKLHSQIINWNDNLSMFIRLAILEQLHSWCKSLNLQFRN